MRATTSLALYDLFFNSVFIKYMRIYSYFPFVFQLNRVMGEAIFWPPFSFQTLRQRCMAFPEVVVYAAILAHPGKSCISRPVFF